MFPFSGRSRRRRGVVRAARVGGFTLIELLTVITVIVLLVGLIVGVAGFANTKAARTRAEAEIRALSTAMENYKSDNGTYPRSPAKTTDSLNARKSGNPDNYLPANVFLYRELSGDRNCDGAVNLDDQNVDSDGGKLEPPLTSPPRRYYEFKPNMLTTTRNNGAAQIRGIGDPWGMSYGYSTANQADATAGYNPTFDLWSVANKVSTSPVEGALDASVRPSWITNW